MRSLAAIATIVTSLLAGGAALAAADHQIRITEAQTAGELLELRLSLPGEMVLDTHDFTVTVNDKPVPRLRVTPEDGTAEAVGVVLAVDVSGSMAGRPLSEAKKAVRRFLKTLEPSDRVALVAFSTKPRVVSGFGASRRSTLRNLRRLSASGETALYDAVIRAVSLVENRLPDQRNIVVLSDGADTSSAAGLATGIAAARRADATVNIVGLESPDYSAGQVEPLATRTGGKLLRTTKATRLSQLFSSFARRLVSSRYAMTFGNPDPEATTLALAVEVVHEGKRLTGHELLRLTDSARIAPVKPQSGGPPVMLIIAVFVSVSFTAFVVYEAFRRRRNSPATRIDWYDDSRSEDIDSDALIDAAILRRAKDLATEVAEKTGYLERIERDIEAAGLRWRAGELIVAGLGISAAGFILGFVLGGVLFALMTGVISAVAPLIIVKRKSSKRRKEFSAQLPDTLLLISGALRAGYSFQQAIDAVGTDAKPPTSEEFGRTMAEVRLGGSLEGALSSMARRLGIEDFEWTVFAIQVQREVGGNLAEILDIISSTIRERERLRRHLGALTAEGRLSGWVLGVLPFVMTGVLLLISPEYLEPLVTTSKGLNMLAVSGTMMAIGVLWMRKIVRIRM